MLTNWYNQYADEESNDNMASATIHLAIAKEYGSIKVFVHTIGKLSKLIGLNIDLELAKSSFYYYHFKLTNYF